MNVTVQICIYKRKITSTIFNFLRFHEKKLAWQAKKTPLVKSVKTVTTQ